MRTTKSRERKQMNKVSYLQGDSRWGGLVYPKKPCYIRNVGCGEVSIANILIEMEQYVNYTPAVIQPYCKQYGAPNCDGTYLSAICKMMKHYGMEEVKECATMPELWKEMKKGNRVAVLLMGSRPAGSKKVHWTSGGHFIAACGYKYEDKKRYLYIKDPWTIDKNRNGWLSYEESLKNDVVGVYVGKLVQKEVEPSEDGKLTVDGIGGQATILAMQKYFGVKENGYIYDQMEKLSQYYPSIISVRFGKGKEGSAVIKALQKWLGLTRDGIIGQGTTAAWQKRLRDLGYLGKKETIDGIFGVKSMKAWQKFLNDHMNEDGNSPSPKPTNKKTYRVIDVSDWQGKIDWKKVKADGIVGAIIRYADGDTLDGRFKENMKNASKAGLHIGAYIFSRAKTKAEAEKEAVRLADACEPYDVDLPLYIDLEAKGLEKYANTVAQAFIDKIRDLGFYPGVYASLNWWNNYLKPTAKLSFAMWVAQYNDTMDYKPSTDVGMWQYTSSGKVDGISGKVDRDRLYIPYWEKIPTANGRKIGVKANKFAYDTDTDKADYPKGSPKKAYTEAIAEVYPNHNKWGTAPSKGASCDVFVGTCVRSAGVDTKFPRGLDEQIDYLAKSSKFKEVSVTIDTVKDGDIIVYARESGGAHICIACDGKVKEAGYKHYYPKTTDYLKDRLSKEGKKWLKVYRAKTK